MNAARWASRTRSRFRALASLFADARRRARNLWHLADYDWTLPDRERLPRPWPKGEATIIDISDPLRETYETIRKENTGQA